MKPFQLTIVTPTGKIFDQEVEMVSAPGASGRFGILAHHTPFATILKKGVVKVKSASEEKSYRIDSGLLEMTVNNQCLILSNYIEPAV
jgi:F-type H+-transporting ATPase subunit epsilon